MSGRLPEGVTATDLVLTITEALRKRGVVGKFVEFYGPGLKHLTIADRVTLGNMCPEYGATVAIFPIDDMTLEYLRFTGRDAAQVALVEAYAKAQGLFRTDATPDAVYAETIELDLATVEPSLAGPRRPQDRVALGACQVVVRRGAAGPAERRSKSAPRRQRRGGGGRGRRSRGHAARARVGGHRGHHELHEHVESQRHDRRRPRRQASGRARPHAQAVGQDQSGARIEGRDRTIWQRPACSRISMQLGFNLVGYGCTTCIGNSGPLPDEIAAEVRERGLVVCSVLSGNRNFEGRIQQDVRANYLASPPLVVAYALAGSLNVDLTTEPLGTDRDGQPGVSEGPVADRDSEIQQTMLRVALGGDVPCAVCERLRRRRSAGARCRCRPAIEFAWEPDSTYIRKPPFLEDLSREPAALETITGRACARACSATASRPITFLRRARSRRTVRPGSI